MENFQEIASEPAQWHYSNRPMPNVYNLHFNHVSHLTTSPGLGNLGTAYCTAYFPPQSFGEDNIHWWRHGYIGQQLFVVASSETWNRAGFGLVFHTALILCGRQADGEFSAQSTGNSQGICWAALAMMYACWKSL